MLELWLVSHIHVVIHRANASQEGRNKGASRSSIQQFLYKNSSFTSKASRSLDMIRVFLNQVYPFLILEKSGVVCVFLFLHIHVCADTKTCIGGMLLSFSTLFILFIFWGEEKAILWNWSKQILPHWLNSESLLLPRTMIKEVQQNTQPFFN